MERGRAIWPALVFVAGACLAGGLFAGYLLRAAAPRPDAPAPAPTPTPAEPPAPAGEPSPSEAERELVRVRAELEDAVQHLEHERATNERLREELTAAESDLRRLREELARRNAPPPAVAEAAPTPPEPPPKLEGTLQAVDVDADIYILSLGERDGVKAGGEFSVFRKDEYVGTVVLEKVFKSHASAHMKPGTKRLDPRAGDRVTNEF